VSSPDRHVILNFQEMATDLLDEAGGDRTEALKLGQEQLRAFLAENPKRAIEAVMPILSNKLWDMLRSLSLGPKHNREGGADARARHDLATTGLSALGRDYVYGFILPGGQKLGGAMREDVERARRVYAATAQENTRNAIWLAMIAREMTNGKSVAKAFTEERLHKMLKGATEEAATALAPKAKELSTR
jgi:hypothetical protein